MLTVQGSWTVKWDFVAKSVINFKAANYSALVNPEYFERYVLINKYFSFLNKRLTVKSEMEISVFMLVSITYIASGVNSGEPLLLVSGIFSAYLLLVFKNPTESERSSTLNFDRLLQKNKIGCFLVLLKITQKPINIRFFAF